MRKFCLTKDLADRLKALAIKGEINISDMYNMSSTERKSLFEKWVDADTAQKINAGFEEAMISEQQSALKKWAEKTFSGSEKVAGKKKDVFDKIESLTELGVLSPQNADAFLSDLVATKLGATITAEEASTIAEKSTKLQELAKENSKFGTPTVEYFKAKKDMENYLESLNPSSELKVATSIIGRGSMLSSVKSPLVNIESNTVQALLTGAERRLISGQFSGVNGEYARDYIKYVNEVYDASGYDVSRMESLQGTQKIRGEEITTSEGKGKTRKIGRIYEDLVFKKLMGKPDVVFSAIHFADSANLASTKIARGEGLKGAELKARSLEIFKDSTNLNPLTPEGQKVREQAIADAQYATYTNESKYSDVALGIRKLLNVASGDVRLGDQLMPFVKTPANVVGAGIDYSGVVLPIDTLLRVGKVIKQVRSGETLSQATMDSFQGYTRKLVRAGLGTTLAFILSQLFDPDDFIGEYPVSPKEQELLELQNATTNSVKIGNKWVSLDYFGALGTPLVAMLYAKKYGKDTAGAMYSYYVGAGRQLAKIPGLEIGKDVFEILNRTKFEGISAVTGSIKKGAVDYVRSRTIPAFIYDLAKATDKYERQVDKNKPLQSVQSSIPGLRQGLPRKMTVLGKDIESESPLSTLLFGSRAKTVADDPVVNEIVRLAETGNLPSITDYSKTSTRMKELKSQVGDERYREAEKFLGETLNNRYQKEMNTNAYKKMTDEKKAEELNKIKTDVLELTLRKFKYKKLGDKR